MTDQHDPDQPVAGDPPAERPAAQPASERSGSDVPPLELPTVGRPPAPVSGSGARGAGTGAEPAEDDEPTVVSGLARETRPAAPKRTKPYLRGADDDKTRLLRPPPVETDDGETRVLHPPSRAGADADARAGTRPTDDARPQAWATGDADARPETWATDGANARAEGRARDDANAWASAASRADADARAEARARAAAAQRGADAVGRGADAVGRGVDGARVQAGGAPGDEPTVERGRPAAGGVEARTGRSVERVKSVRGGDGAAAVGSGDGLVPDEAEDGSAGPAAVSVRPGSAGGSSESVGAPPEGDRKSGKKKLTSAGALIWVLLALLGYTLVVQLRSNNDDQGLATARQEDLVSILSDLESRDSRLQSEITSLEASQRQLTSGVSSRQAALAEAEKRADELGLLAGTLPGRGPGLKIVIDKVKASAILNAVEELRGAGGEVMELAGVDGTAVRIVASSYFVDAAGGGIDADGTRLDGPWTLWVIGSPATMQTALQIPGGVVASVQGAGGSVNMEPQTMVEVTAVRKASTLQYAHPAS